MSLLTGSAADLKGGSGSPLPDGTYRGTIETAEIIPMGQNGGEQLKQRIGNIRTYSKDAERDSQPEITRPDGSTFRIGGRKAFSKFWTTHPGSPKAQEVGNRSLLRQAASAGLAHRNGDGVVTVEHASWQDYAQASVGQDVIFRSKQVPRLRNGTPVLDEDEKPIVDVEVADFVVVA